MTCAQCTENLSGTCSLHAAYAVDELNEPGDETMELKDKLFDANERIEEYRRTVTSLNESCESSRLTIVGLMEERDEARTELAQCERLNQEVALLADQMREQRNEARRERDRLEVVRGMLVEERDAFKTKLEELTGYPNAQVWSPARCIQAESERDALKAENAELRDEARTSLASMTWERDGLQAKLEREFRVFQERLKPTLLPTQDERDAAGWRAMALVMQREKDALRAQLLCVTSERDQFRGRYEGALEEVGPLRSERDAALAKLEERTQQLNIALVKAQGQLAKAESERDAALAREKGLLSTLREVQRLAGEMDSQNWPALMECIDDELTAALAGSPSEGKPCPICEGRGIDDEYGTTCQTCKGSPSEPQPCPRCEEMRLALKPVAGRRCAMLMAGGDVECPQDWAGALGGTLPLDEQVHRWCSVCRVRATLAGKAGAK